MHTLDVVPTIDQVRPNDGIQHRGCPFIESLLQFESLEALDSSDLQSLLRPSTLNFSWIADALSPSKKCARGRLPFLLLQVMQASTMLSLVFAPPTERGTT